ncbi:MAG: serine acetyltransferase [Betaproteobacteria bacterium]|jgi:serine O-acetyltransferase|nr:serine acetyltransferase [Betaproteobacteria bacterium]
MRQAARHKANATWVQVGDGSHLELHHTPWWRHIYRDFRRYRVTADPALRTVFLTQGFWASCVYRVSRAALLRTRLARPFIALAQKLIEIVTGISLPPQCEIGEGLYIGHYGSIIVAPPSRIGHNCSLAQNVTVGVAGSGDNRGAPVIGNRVFIGAHSIIVGRITVGDDAVICAGSVVTRSVPARAMVMGNPARVVSYDGSFDYIFYDGMDADPARKASLERARSLNVGPA